MRRALNSLSSGLLALLAILAMSAAAQAAVSPLVDAGWLRANASAPGVAVLDIRNKLGDGPEQAYRDSHVPGAVYSDYLAAGWRTNIDGVAGQLPPVSDLVALIGGLGNDNASHVVIVSGGTSALDMGSATRVYWTFKVLGHDSVSILDGGYAAYAADAANPVETGFNTPSAKIFSATVRPEMLADREAVAAQKSGVALVDMRPPPA